MTTIKTTIRWIKRILATALTLILFAAIQGGTLPPQGRMVDITQDDDGLTLVWRGIPNATYRVEQRTNLLADTWTSQTPLVVPGQIATWQIGETAPSSQFFRVQFPTPELIGSEPAFVPQAGGTTVFVTGNYFYEGDQIRVDGVLLTNVVFISHNLLSGELPNLAPGLHDVDVLNSLSGNVLKALPNALEVAPSFERTMQGPPEWPLAGPASLRGVVEPRDPPTGQATGKRMHAPRSSGSGLPTGKRMHTPVRSSSNGGHWGDPHENGLALRSPGGGLDDDCDGDGLSDALDPDSDDDGLSDVYLYSGEVRQQVIDLAVPGRGLDFVWGRTYRSRTGTSTPQGNRWTHSYEVRCVQNSYGDMEVFDGSGRKDIFRLQADGTYACPELFREGTLDAGTGTFRLTFADTGYWEFCPFDAISPKSGKLDRIVDRNGNTMALNYDDAGQLVEIVDDLGRTHTVAYTPAGQVASVTDSSGRTVAYTYYGVGESDGAAGDLKSVTSPSVTGTSTGNDFPNGKTTTYTYTTNTAAGAGSLLLSVVDARDQTAVTCVYDLDSTSPTFARCLSIQRAAEAPTTITYLPQAPAPSNRFAAMRCIVNDPEGNVSEYDFDLRNRCLSLTAFTGRAEPGQWVTADANRPTNPLRPDDPASFKITWTWNDGSLCTSETLASGDRTEWVYQGDLNATTPPRFRANLREERCIAIDDADGVERNAEVVVRGFEHDPRFGFERRTGRNPQTGKEIKIAAKKVAKFKAGKALADTVKSFAPDGIGAGDSCPSKDDDCDGFVTRVINPRGFETHGEYDANGNLISRTRIVRDRTPPKMSFSYNAYGQLTAITNALDANDQRRVDTVDYYASGPQHGYLQKVTVDAGASGHNITTSYEYDARGNVTRCVDPRGTATEIEVNALNQIVASQTQGATLSEREACRFVYDANNNLVQVDRENRAPDGTLDAANPAWTTTLEYDTRNRLVQTAQELSQSGALSIMTNQFVYNANDQLILHRLPEAVSGAAPDNDIAYAYDERGLLFSRVCASGTTLSTGDVCAYDANGNIRKITRVDEDSDDDTVRESTFAYDGFGRCVQATDAMGNVTTHLYDACGNRTYTKIEGELLDLPGGTLNRTLAEESFTYDALNQLTGRSVSFFNPATGAPIDDGISQTAWAYAPNGQLMACTDDNDHTTACTYDSVGRRASVSDPKGNTSSYTYDSNGNLLSEQTADLSDVSSGTQLFTQTFAYDALNRCISVTDNVGNTVSNAYDSSRNLVSSTDALGNESVCTVDGLGRVTDTTHYSGSESGGVILSTSHVAYRNKRCISSTDGNGNITTFAYDALDRCVTVTHQDGTVEVRGWDPRSKLARYTDANGTTVTNTYDLLDRLVQRDIAVAPGVSDTTTFETLTYSGLGQVMTADNDASALSFAYDSIGNRIRSVQDGLVTTCVYDGTGNRLSLTCPDGRSILTAHDALGLPTSLSTRATAGESSISLATFAYDGPGRLAKMTHANGINTRVFWNGDQNTPNAVDDFGWQQVARVNHAKAGGGNVIDQRNNSYDRNQNQSLRVMTTPWTSGGPLTANSYAYDGLKRLTSGLRSSSPAGDSAQSYVLDPNGNRLQVTNNGLTEAYVMTDTEPEPADFQMNQYTEAPSGAFTYDANGNRLSSSNATSQRVYHYDYANRLVQVDELDAGGDLSTLVTYRLSPGPGYRTLDKASTLLSGGVPDGTTTTTYLYDYGIDQDCNGEDDNCDSPTGKDLLQTYVDGVLQRTFVAPDRFAASGATASISGGVVLFHHYSDQGSLLALTDSKGDVVERFDYDDFGAPLFFDASGSPRPDATAPLTDVRQLFQGMVWNEETGLYGGGGGGGPSTQMNKGELIDAIAKDAGLSMYDPLIGRDLSRPYGGTARYSSPWARGPLIDRTSSVLVPDLPRKGDTYARGRIRIEGGIDIDGATSSLYGGGGAGKATYGIAAKKVAKFKAGKALAETVK